MLTLKFGGTSMGNARRILDSTDIVIEQQKKERVSVIVSAVAGVSNKLQESIDGSVRGENPERFVKELRSIHLEICRELQSKLAGFDSDSVMKGLEDKFVELQNLLTAAGSFGECTDTAHCRIMGMGELLCVPIVEAVLLAKKQSVIVLDSRKFIMATGNQKEAGADYAKTAELLRPYCDGEYKSQTKILLMPGFVCSWISGEGAQPLPGLLGRNGSDFSAAIVGACMGSKQVQFWTDVDGIYTADPRIVKDAILVDDMTYEEAMELAFFGSKVLHPKTLAPLAAKGIEAWSLNSLNRSARGTRIGKGPFENSNQKASFVRGISCLKKTSIISVSGSGMRDRPGIAGRIFDAVSRAGISVLLITQSSSEYTISFCVRDESAARAKEAIAGEFDLEIRDGVINPVEVYSNCAIVSIVGDGMKKQLGVASRFFDALANAGVSVLAIAQGSSERSISAVIDGEMGDIAVRMAHNFFFHTAQSIQVFAFGAGNIGGTLLDQIGEQQDSLLAQGIDIKVYAISTVDGLLIDENGIDLKTWRETTKKMPLKTSVDEILKFVRDKKPLNPVFVDCTASYDLPERYLDILEAGMSIATPNKRANSMTMDFYKALRKTANKKRRRFLYETNVGAGLPIIDTLQNLFRSGDKLTRFMGIMSGSLSYIFGRLDEGVAFSQAVLEAKEKRYTEPDPRDDLNGMDVARKGLIIAREAGYDIELSDVEVLKVFPDDFDTSGSTEEFLKRLPQVDDYFKKKIDALKKQNKVLRMGATVQDGKCTVGMFEVGPEDPLYMIKGGENAFVFYTARYQPIPLTVRGYGAGAGVTAAGVFGDILRTVSFNTER
ncbi:MAG: bifunctional aspartate kinase/homoserine dehydrogenase I [Treponema sp.]|nr:bifunctional aspartate kinase/homoserine dehydrogenase I [Treponema sp.]